MKRTFYIFCCIVLGLLFSSLLHVTLEQVVIALLISDFETFNLGFSWNSWFVIHHVLSITLFIWGIVFGYRLGVQWWRIVYLERKHGVFFKAK